MLAFINARRAVGNQTPIAPTTDMTVLLKELMEQKTLFRSGARPARPWAHCRRH
jgi:hypothetical protein